MTGPETDLLSRANEKKRKPLLPRVWAKTKVDPETGCWTYTGSRLPEGYGRIGYRGKPWLVHRAVYTEVVGPIPDGFQIDHLCRNTSCCNPAHLEAVTQRENILRGNGITAQCAAKTHCPHGHEDTPENTLVMTLRRTNTTIQGRVCKTCYPERNLPTVAELEEAS